MFREITDKQQFTPDPGPSGRYLGASGQPLYYCLVPAQVPTGQVLTGQVPTGQVLLVVSGGEWQPTRWTAWLEGIWATGSQEQESNK
jgi:hypothetical protein